MTRFPTETRQIQGLEGEEYERYDLPSSICAAPGCQYEGTDRHHLFSRGLMGGGFDWVRLADGEEVGNIVGLCYLHHKNVTENRVHINYRDGLFYWGEAPLAYQPPRKGFIPPVLDENERAVCPTCKRTMPRPRLKNPKEDRKPRKTWSVAVPYDVQEDGADVIDELLLAAEEKLDHYGLNWGHGARVVYFKLTTVLALFVQHADDILKDD